MANIDQVYLRSLYRTTEDFHSGPKLSFSDIITDVKERIPVENPSEQRVSLSTLQRKIIDSVGYCREVTKDVKIEAEIMNYNCSDHIDRVYAELHKLPCLPNSCSITMIQVRPEPDVEFIPDYTQQDGTICPMFKLVVQGCKPNTMQNINTGFILIIPPQIEIINPMNEHPMISKTKAAFVIIPYIRSSNKNIVPSIHARDADDTGPYTVSVYNRCGRDESCEIEVFLHAYCVRLDLNSLSYDNYNDKHPTVIQKKDLPVFERKIYNFSPLVKLCEGVVENKSIKFPCYDDITFCRQKTNIIIQNQFVFFESPKGEWCNTNLFTLSGVFSPNAPLIEQKEMMPRVMCNGKNNQFNTHCIVQLDSRLTLKSSYGILEPKYLAINGAMRDIGDYKNIKKALRKLLVNANSVSKKFGIEGLKGEVENQCEKMFIHFKTVANEFYKNDPDIEAFKQSLNNAGPMDTK